MSKFKSHGEYATYIDSLSMEEIDEMVAKDECPFDPEWQIDPQGMFHCPACGMMLTAGVPHPRKRDQ